MISCEKENLKNLILDMANRLHSDVALTCAHWAGMSPAACSLSLPSNTAVGPGDAQQLGLQLSPTSSFPPFRQLLPGAPGVAPCRDTTRSPVPGLGSFSPSAWASCPGNVTSCMVSSQSSRFCCCPVLPSHYLSLTKCVVKPVRNFLWPLVPFSGGFGLVLLWPEHAQQSVQQPPRPQRSAGSPAARLLAQCWKIKAAAPGLVLYSVWGKDQVQWDQPRPSPLRLSTHWLCEKCQGKWINNLTEEQKALVDDCCSP